MRAAALNARVPSVSSFVRVVETWLPDRQGTLLEFSGGHFGTARRFAAISRTMCFGRGEGLPGRAWEAGRPIVLKDLAGPYFRRGEAALADGLACGVAMPVFAGERLTAVLTIFCGDDSERVGAIELWRNDPKASPDMTLDDGYYGATSEVFEFISRHTSFRRGTGLPGSVWQSGLPLFLPDLGKGGRFLRADSAEKVGINRGFALPCSTTDGAHYVMAFLSARGTPIVRRFETWLPDPPTGTLRRAEGFCERFGAVPPGDSGDAVLPGQGALGRAWSSGAPAIAQRATDEHAATAAAARLASLEAQVAIPVHRGGEVAAVVAWYF
jgi:hypothetical protein